MRIDKRRNDAGKGVEYIKKQMYYNDNKLLFAGLFFGVYYTKEIKASHS